MQRIITGLVVLLIGGGVFGYQKFGGKLGLGGGGSPDKLGAYIECMNRFSSRAFDSQKRYLSWADAEKGPEGKRNVMGLYTLYEPKQCLDGIAAAEEVAPRNAELEAAGKAYAAALAKLEPLLREANDYYEQKNFQDDKFAKGKELHPKLMAAFDEFGAADRALRGMVVVMNREKREKSLAEREKSEGRNLGVLLDRMMLDAETLMVSGEVKDWSEVKVDEFGPRLAAYEKAVLELDAYASSHPNEAPTAFSFVLSGAKDYLTASKELMRRARDKQGYSGSEKMNVGGQGEWMVSGSPGKMLKAYNSLVDHVNRL